MANANLLEILNKETKLENMIVYGNVRCAIDKPAFLSQSIKISSGFFALVDVLALRCNGVDYFGEEYQDSKHIYFSKGSMVIALEDKSLIGENVRVYGRSLKGCTVKKQRTGSPRDGIVAFAWTKQNGDWVIVPNKTMRLGESDIKGTVLEDYIVSKVCGVPFSYPKSVETYMEYSGVSEVKPIEKEEVIGALNYSTDPIDLSSIPLNLVHNLGPHEASEYLDLVGGAVGELKKSSQNKARLSVRAVKKYLENEEQDSDGIKSLDDISEDIVYGFIDSIASKYNLPLGTSSKVKGKDFVDELLDELSTANFRNLEDEDKEAVKLSKQKRYKDIEGIKKAIALDESVLLPDRTEIPSMNNIYTYASMVIGVVTGIGVQAIVSNHNSVTRNNDLDTKEWFWCLIRNPYLCGLMGGGLNIMDCDRVYYAFSEDSRKEECKKVRDMVMMLGNIKNASSRSTLILKRNVLNMPSIYPKLGTRYLGINGVPYSVDCITAVNLMTGGRLNSVNVFSNSIDNKRTLGCLIDSGLIEEVNNGVILARDLEKEYVIYKVLQEKGTQLTGIEDDGIDTVISKFEESRGFKLETLQKDGVHLVKYKAGVLSGCAGSGKTTTSDCMVECFKAYMPDYTLKFGAPTGKAARRLAEVVGGGVKTIHSMFGIGLEEEPYLSEERGNYRKKSKEGEKCIYILDEMAMSNTNLMYSIVNNLESEDIVYFLGDIKQLSPIGKGSPFRSLMSFLPCVELGVSKRAAANGKINYNCGLINFVSDEYVVELQEGDDFEITCCADVDIQREVVNSFAKELNTFEEDDIQVVTGYQNEKYPWSTTNLNPYLQNLLRKDTELLYTYNERKFMTNDRVIHIRRNAYDMPRFKLKNGCIFEEVVTSGIVNGELGKIVGYRNSMDCVFVPFENNFTDEQKAEMDKEYVALLDKRENSSVDIRDEEGYKDENMYFIIVQVYDVDLKEDVYVLYHANYREKEDSDYYVKNFSGGDLAYLDLAYALTTHKMQGSQSPCIIMPLGSKGSSSFMNRNMINTMITRASKKVTLIGSVKGKDSALTNGRRITNIDDSQDVLSLLAE